MEELVSKADYKEELGGGGKIMYIITRSISSYQQLQSHPPKTKTHHASTVQPTVHLYTSRQEWAGFHQKGVEWRGTELGDGITMATRRTSAVQSRRWMWAGVVTLKWSEVGGNRSSLLRFWEILMAAVQALTVMNSSHTLTQHTHTPLHHRK